MTIALRDHDILLLYTQLLRLSPKEKTTRLLLATLYNLLSANPITLPPIAVFVRLPSLLANLGGRHLTDPDLLGHLVQDLEPIPVRVGDVGGVSHAMVAPHEEFHAVGLEVPQLRQEGVPVGSDTIVILKNAPHPNTATLFLDYMLRPENSAANTKAIGYPMQTAAGLKEYASLGFRVADPQSGKCVTPYHDPARVNHGGPHGQGAAIADINGGSMNGFIAQAQRAKGQCTIPNDPVCTTPGATDVMGYHDGGEIPNYWAYAKNFVLQDRMFEPNLSWSLPEHLYAVSAWSARCTVPGNAMSCTSALQNPATPPDFNKQGAIPDYPWTDLTYLLHRHGVSWGYYVFQGTEPDCENEWPA